MKNMYVKGNDPHAMANGDPQVKGIVADVYFQSPDTNLEGFPIAWLLVVDVESGEVNLIRHDYAIVDIQKMEEVERELRARAQESQRSTPGTPGGASILSQEELEQILRGAHR